MKFSIIAFLIAIQCPILICQTLETGIGIQAGHYYLKNNSPGHGTAKMYPGMHINFNFFDYRIKKKHSGIALTFSENRNAFTTGYSHHSYSSGTKYNSRSFKMQMAFYPIHISIIKNIAFMRLGYFFNIPIGEKYSYSGYSARYDFQNPYYKTFGDTGQRFGILGFPIPGISCLFRLHLWENNKYRIFINSSASFIPFTEYAGDYAQFFSVRQYHSLNLAYKLTPSKKRTKRIQEFKEKHPTPEAIAAKRQNKRDKFVSNYAQQNIEAGIGFTLNQFRFVKTNQIIDAYKRIPGYSLFAVYKDARIKKLPIFGLYFNHYSPEINLNLRSKNEDTNKNISTAYHLNKLGFSLMPIQLLQIKKCNVLNVGLVVNYLIFSKTHTQLTNTLRKTGSSEYIDVNYDFLHSLKKWNYGILLSGSSPFICKSKYNIKLRYSAFFYPLGEFRFQGLHGGSRRFELALALGWKSKKSTVNQN